MMRTVVTGAAGFVGSHLCTHLLEQGDDVVGIDAMTDFYDVTLKEANLAALTAWDSFTFHRVDLLDAPLRQLLDGAEVVFHLAGQPGVRPSWGSEFAVYVERNILATQRLLEALRHVSVRKIVYSSSSSVYGDAESYPTAETVRPRPVSPYGVTKLAAEHLCELYRANFGTPTASLRLFTVYGPGQRPDMAFSRLIGAALSGRSLPAVRRRTADPGLHLRRRRRLGDARGRPVRLDRCRQHRRRIADLDGGGHPHSRVAGRAEVKATQAAAQPGDVRDTAADTAVARQAFGYVPAVPLAEGLARMVEDRSSHAWNGGDVAMTGSRAVTAKPSGRRTGIHDRHRGGQAWNCVN